MDNYKKYASYLTLSLLLTVIGSYSGGMIAFKSNLLLVLMPFILLILFAMTSGVLKKIFFAIFCFGEGLSLAPILMYYTNVELYKCLLLTFMITTMFLIIGFKSKDLGYLGKILFAGLIILVLYSTISIFVTLPSIAVLAVILFSLYIAYDINVFKKRNERGLVSEDEVLTHVMNMYLNILNLFIYLLDVLNTIRDN